MVSDKIVAKFDESPLWLGINYNSHPLTLEVSLAVINIYESDNLIENTNKVGAKLRELGFYTFVCWGYIFIAPPLMINEKNRRRFVHYFTGIKDFR
jgi:hypothetical protein